MVHSVLSDKCKFGSERLQVVTRWAGFTSTQWSSLSQKFSDHLSRRLEEHWNTGTRCQFAPSSPAQADGIVGVKLWMSMWVEWASFGSHTWERTFRGTFWRAASWQIPWSFMHPLPHSRKLSSGDGYNLNSGAYNWDLLLVQDSDHREISFHVCKWHCLLQSVWQIHYIWAELIFVLVKNFMLCL